MRRFEHYRLDLVIERAVRKDGRDAVEFVMAPDPDRYEWRTRDEEEFLFDRLDHVWIPREMYEDGMRQMAGTPLFFDPPAIPDSEQYARERVAEFGKLVAGEDVPSTFEDVSDEFLRSLPDTERQFVIMSVDIAGSTSLATTSDHPTYVRVVGAITTELSRVIPLFRGHVLKYTGDGLIAYFATPNFIGKNDLAIDCALALQTLVRLTINPVLARSNLTSVNLRIGLDSGSASVVTLGDPSTKQQKDILGSIVSLACKIQTQAPVGGVALGDETLRALHTSWRQRCERLVTGPDWRYKRDGKAYPLHRVLTSADGEAGQALAKETGSGLP